MRFALLKDDKVVNVIEAEADYPPPDGFTMMEAKSANIGDLWDGKRLVYPFPLNPRPHIELVFIAEGKARQAVSRKAGVEITVRGSPPVAVDLALGEGIIAKLESLKATAIADPDKKHKRAFAVTGDSWEVVTVSLSLDDIVALSDAVNTYHQQIDTALAEIIEDIYAKRITTVKQVEAHSKWPSNKFSIVIGD